MKQASEDQYVEARDGGYYVAGSRVSLASIIHAFRRGAAPEVILDEFPAIGNLAAVYGAIAFILQNPDVVEGYLADQARLWDELERNHPLPPEMAARFKDGHDRLRRPPA